MVYYGFNRGVYAMMFEELSLAYDYRYAVTMFRVNPGKVCQDDIGRVWCGYWV